MLSTSHTVSRLSALLFLVILAVTPITAAGQNKPHPAVSARERGADSVLHAPHVPESSVTLTGRAGESRRSLETGDLKALRRLGRLRVLVPERHDVNFPDRGPEAEDLLLDGLGQSLKLELERIPVPNQMEFAQALLSGRGDLVIAPSPFGQRSTPPPGIAASLPLGTEALTVVARKNSIVARLGGLEAAFGRTIRLPANSSIWTDVPRLERKYPWVRFESAPLRLGLDGIARDVAAGRIEATLLPQSEASTLVAAMPELTMAFTVGSPAPIAWYLRTSNPELLAAVNAYLEQHQVAYRPSERYQGDLPELRHRGVLRAIVRQDGDEFFLAEGKPAGLAHAELQQLAESLDLRLELRIAQSQDEARGWLDAGQGDLIATPLAVTRAGAGLATTLPYHYVAPVVVARSWSGLSAPEDLNGMRCLLAPDSPHRAAIEALTEATGIVIELVEEPRFRDRARLLREVIDDDQSFTVVDGDQVSSSIAGQTDLRATLSLTDPSRFRFSLRSSDRELLGAVNASLRHHWPSKAHRSLVATWRKPSAQRRLSLDFSRLSPFDEMVQKSASAHGFDWRLIVSIMYQESQFDPHARSPQGALGLMQVLPSTARALGVHDLLEPGSAILAGVRYLEELREAFADDIAVKDRTWFAVAAYHAGPSRLRQARTVAAEMGLDPDRWFGHVELAMQGLADQGAGKVRGAVFLRTVRYVREVRERFDTYVQVAAPQFAALPVKDRAARL